MRPSSESGQATLMTALTLPVFCGFLGLAIDVGHFYSAKRDIQLAADASAIAAVRELKRGNVGVMTSAARTAANANGFAGDVSVNHPPASGPHAGDADYVEVVASAPVDNWFMRFLVADESIEVRGRAVAGLTGVPPAGVFVLSQSADKALEVSSGSRLTSALDILVSSNSPNALSVTSGSCLTAPGIGVTGGYEGRCFSSTPITDMPPEVDPLAALPPPPFGATCDFIDWTVDRDDETLRPGIYCGGLKVSSNSSVRLEPGIYVLRGGGLEVNSSSTITGVGVSLYNTGDKTYAPNGIRFKSNSTAVLSAPTSGALAGVLIFSDRTLPTESSLQVSFSSSAEATLEGAIYAPNQHVQFQSGSKPNTLSPWTVIVANTFEVSSGSRLDLRGDFATSKVPSPIRTPALVE